MAIEKFNGGVMVAGERDTNLAGLLALRTALKLEVKTGLKMSRGKSAQSIVKQRFGLKGNKQKIYDQFNEIVEAEIEKRNLSVMAETGENN